MTPTENLSVEPIGEARELLDVLDYESCRRVLVALVEAERRGDSEISSQALWDEDTADLFQKGRCYSHLLKLDSSGFVDWGRETDTIERGPRFDELLSLLARVDSKQAEVARDADTDSSLDDLFDALSHPFRRLTLTALAHPESLPSEGSVPTRRPMEECRDSEVDGGEPDVLERELRQRHLALLDEYGFVDWDPQTDTLTRGPRFDDARPVLEFLSEYRNEAGSPDH